MTRALLLLATALGGCASSRPEAAAVPSVAPVQNWRAVARVEDRTRIRNWRTAWTEALRLARAAGHGQAITREGVLLQPDAALPGAALPDGAYGCRVVKVGGQSQSTLHYVAYPQFDCRIDRENGVQHFVKLSGSQRPTGHLYDDGDRRSVFLGTLMLGDEKMAMDYGQDRTRDMAGIVERVGPARWRLVLPYPRFESIVDVVELVPRSS